MIGNDVNSCMPAIFMNYLHDVKDSAAVITPYRYRNGIQF